MRAARAWIVPVVVCALAGACGDAADGPVLDLPPRPADAPGGTALARELRGLELPEREARIYDEVARGNVPGWLRRLHRVEGTTTIDGRERTVQFWAAPDYLSIGSDDDYFYVPLSPRTARRIADLVGGSLPAPWMVDAIWRAARVRLVPVRLRPDDEMWSIGYFERHSRLIQAQARQHGARAGRLVAGHKLDVVRAPPSEADTAEADTAEAGTVEADTSVADTGDAAIYGWHQSDGAPIQPVQPVDPDTRPHFSMGVRLVYGPSTAND